MEEGNEADRDQLLLLERLLARVVRDEQCDCWLWNGACSGGRYGTLRVGGEMKYTHRLIAALFLGLDEESGQYVLHVWDRTQCCNPNHLRLGTHRDNMEDASAKGRLGKKLTPAEVIEIRRLRAAGLTQQALADRFSVSRMTIRQIERRETWRHLPDADQDASTRSHSTLDSLAESA